MRWDYVISMYACELGRYIHDSQYYSIDCILCIAILILPSVSDDSDLDDDQPALYDTPMSF